MTILSSGGDHRQSDAGLAGRGSSERSGPAARKSTTGVALTLRVSCLLQVRRCSSSKAILPAVPHETSHSVTHNTPHTAAHMHNTKTRTRRLGQLAESDGHGDQTVADGARCAAFSPRPSNASNSTARAPRVNNLHASRPLPPLTGAPPGDRSISADKLDARPKVVGCAIRSAAPPLLPPRPPVFSRCPSPTHRTPPATNANPGHLSRLLARLNHPFSPPLIPLLPDLPFLQSHVLA